MERDELAELIEDHIRKENDDDMLDLFANIMNWLEEFDDGTLDETDIVYLASEFEMATG